MDDPQNHAGEPWADVIHNGHGIYAHVEEIRNNGTPTPIVNIEYTILWAYNLAECSEHEADITTMIVNYDRSSDRLVRLSYSVHGYALEEFDLTRSSGMVVRYTYGLDDVTVVQSYPSIAVSFPSSATYQHGGVEHSPSDPLVYLAQDPDTHRFEHPLAFAEHGGHELWPNSTGSVKAAAKHTGDGISFIPENVQTLGTVAHPQETFSPLVYLNGLFGSDATSLALHKSWYWPLGRSHISMDTDLQIPDSRFTDQDPYDGAGLGWPPTAFRSEANTTVYVNAGNAPQTIINGELLLTNGASVDGSRARPFANPDVADSFVAPGGTIVLEAGHYLGIYNVYNQGRYSQAFLLNRPAVFRAEHGAAIFGQ